MSQPSSGPEADDPSTDVSGPSSSVPVDPDPTIAEVDATVIDDLEGDPVLDLMGVLEAERDSYLSDLQRVSAEFANFRKQAEKRSIEVGARARGALAERLLPVLDACDLAIEHGADIVVPIRSSLVHALEPAGGGRGTPSWVCLGRPGAQARHGEGPGLTRRSRRRR